MGRLSSGMSCIATCPMYWTLVWNFGALAASCAISGSGARPRDLSWTRGWVREGTRTVPVCRRVKIRLPGTWVASYVGRVSYADEAELDASAFEARTALVFFACLSADA